LDRFLTKGGNFNAKNKGGKYTGPTRLKKERHKVVELHKRSGKNVKFHQWTGALPRKKVKKGPADSSECSNKTLG